MKWLPEALDDLERLYHYLLGKSPDAAQRAAVAILEGADLLNEHPGVGKPMDDARREWFIRFGAGAYVLRYRIDPDGEPIVIRVWHSREDRND